MTLEINPAITLGRAHARRLRDLYRSAGWPSQDKVEVELLAGGLLERVTEVSGVVAATDLTGRAEIS